MDSGYTLRFPFQIEAQREISKLEIRVESTIEGITISLEQAGEYYVVKACGFESEEGARNFLPKLWAGLVWVVLNRHMGFNAMTEFDTIIYAEDPQLAAENIKRSFGIQLEGPVDGLAN